MAFDRSAAAARYRRNRARSREIFDLLTEQTYYSRPIALRHPIVFYDGHLPGFSFNTLVKKGLGHPSIDARLETLFARGIDPHETQVGGAGGAGGAGRAGRAGGAGRDDGWPARDEVRAFADEADRQVLDAILHADLDRPGHPLLDRAEAVFTILEHEVMHQETLLYMWHRLPFGQKRKPAGYQPRMEGVPPRREWVQIPAGCATLGVQRGAHEFGWDNEHPALSASVPAFAIERHDVTNEHYLEFVDAGGYRDPEWWLPEDWAWVQREGVEHPLFWEREGDRWHWRGMFDRLPLPAGWPIYVSQAEASAYARWRGARLPTEAEFQRAAYGSPEGERRYPWGDGAPDATRGVFDFAGWDPEAAGSHPKGASSWGVEDLVGNGWEWTSTPFGPFPGFQAMASYPEYSADFFDQQHMVMKGASPVTAMELLRPTFRNWFRSRYPYVYATFRCAT
jgi:iron(II)-dependent oxidoreductase